MGLAHRRRMVRGEVDTMSTMHHAYQYECAHGHYQASHKPLEECVAARCHGELRRIGAGARGPRQRRP